MADKFEELYQKYNLLSNAKENITELSDEYLECIEHAKGTDKEKKLAAQIIAQYFKHFPQHNERALSAVFDLCEDGDPSIRISAIMFLPMLCKHSKEIATVVANILAQLMILLDQQQEFNVTCNSLDQVFKEYPLKTLKALFTQIYAAEPTTRENAVKYIYKKIIKLDEKITAVCTDLLIEEGKKILQVSTVTEFLIIIPFFMNTKYAKTPIGQQELVNLIAHRAEINQEFEGKDSLICDRLIICTDHVLPIFNATVESTEYVKFYCKQILPKWDVIAELQDGEVMQTKLLQLLADLSNHCGKLDTPTSYIVHIFDKLKLYMPLPPDDEDINKIPNLNFSAVECLLYAFHRLVRQAPEFLTSDPTTFNDFRSRLAYFSRGVGGCKRALEIIHNKDEEKIKIAPTLLDNINTLIKDLFYQTPTYRCNIQLSFKPVNSSKKEPIKLLNMQKRYAPIDFNSNNGSQTSHKHMRLNKTSENMKLYTPPSGKFSNNFQSYDDMGGRGRGRGGKGMRGGLKRMKPRGWKN
ncbi:apoptosis inhibitor 5-like [Diabrotica undecimpunctata]|uniref:apoptosis inhibitor 5-like n=1 Tax=Diabrotica undecimpunctata TaxID=50387 RepID=UPI003B642A2D